MPKTRSTSRIDGAVSVTAAAPRSPSKRKAPDASEPGAEKPKRKKKSAVTAVSSSALIAQRVPVEMDPNSTVIPAQLAFSFEDAKAHLIAADSRFRDMFTHVKCKPFEELEPLDPFRSLVISILGQQISWMAAHSITHRFIRLFDPSLPEKAPPTHEKQHESFPTPEEVAACDITTLRTAGLSQRKAEYVQDLAANFADGRLSAAQLANWNESEVAEKLIAVRGIGPWTVHMFSMFSLRQPDILAVGDLGLQKGLVRWVLASHNHVKGVDIQISPKKVANPKASDAVQLPPTPGSESATAAPDASILLPIPDTLVATNSDHSRRTPEPKNSTQLPTPQTPGDKSWSTVLEPLSTPIKTALRASGKNLVAEKPVELPPGMTVASLKARFEGKKIKGNYLTPEEMEFLTESWRPYRSLGTYYLWALSEASE